MMNMSIFKKAKLLVVSHACSTPINQLFFAEVQKQTDWDISIVLPQSWKNEYGKVLIPTHCSDYHGQLIPLHVFRSGDIPLHFYRSLLIKLLQDENPDFIYVHHEPYAIATIQLYIANALSIRKPISFFTWQNIYKNYPFPFRQAESWVLHQSFFAFAGSVGAKEVLIKKGFLGEVEILPGSVDLDVYFPRHEAETIRDQLQSKSEEILIGYVGRLTQEKGLKTLMYALKIIESLPWKLIVIGSGEYQQTLELIASDLKIEDRVRFMGFTPHYETPLYLSAFDVLILPSETHSNWKEQFGRVIIEAMACGTPVVGSDSGEIPNLIHATGGGLIFPEGQPQLLSESLRKMILDSDLRQKLSTQGQEAVKSTYTNVEIAKRFIRKVEEIL
jgi:glycosyltransferase involved in cell wall biosynthesis